MAGYVIDWKRYPKLASWFEHRPAVNVYWVELEAILEERAEDAVRAERARCEAMRASLDLAEEQLSEIAEA